jgi:hypothetical protein
MLARVRIKARKESISDIKFRGLCAEHFVGFGGFVLPNRDLLQYVFSSSSRRFREQARKGRSNSALLRVQRLRIIVELWSALKRQESDEPIILCVGVFSPVTSSGLAAQHSFLPRSEGAALFGTPERNDGRANPIGHLKTKKKICHRRRIQG